MTGPLIPLAVIAAGFLIADRLLPKIRALIDSHRRHPRDGVIFKTFFFLFTAAIIAWLAAGIVPAIERMRPSLHTRLHERTHSSQPIRMDALGFSFNQAHLTLVAGRTNTILMKNGDPGIKHNFVLYGFERGEPEGDEEFLKDNPVGYSETKVDLFSSRAFTGPGVREFSFVITTPGVYLYQCDVTDSDFGDHNTSMNGWITAVKAAVPQAPVSGFWVDLQRGAASAYHYAESPPKVLLDYLFSIATLALGIFLVRKRPLDRVARLLGVAMVGTAAAYNIQSHAALDVLPALGDFIHPFFVHPLSGLLYLYALMLFPDGKLVPQFKNRNVRALYRPAVFGAFVFALAIGGLDEPSPGPGHATAFVQLFGILVPLVGFAAQTYRYRRAQTPELRQQSKVLLWALVPALAFGAVVVLVRQLGGPSGAFRGARVHDLEAFTFRLFQPAFILIPAAIVVGILRYRLWDLDVVINKAILYGSLAAFIGATYVAVVAGFGALLGDTQNPVLSIAVLVVVAVAFEAVRDRVQRFANRLVYGNRATPYEIMANFSQNMSQALSVEDVLPLMAESAARCVGGVRASVLSSLPNGTTRTVVWPPESSAGAFERTFDVWHQGERVGEITVAKAAGDPFTATDERALSSFAAQAGVALQSARLSVELQDRLKVISTQARQLADSRRRIVSARNAERKRIEREINGSVQQRLVALHARIETAAKENQRDVFLPVLDEATEILNALRTISRGIFPALLADQGLTAALDGHIRTIDPSGRIQFDAGLNGTRFNDDAEACVFFCCVEGLRDAGAVKLSITTDSDRIEFCITGRTPVDPTLMEQLTDRVEALGGTIETHAEPDGTVTLSGSVPSYEPEARPQAAVSPSGSSVALEI